MTADHTPFDACTDTIPSGARQWAGVPCDDRGALARTAGSEIRGEPKLTHARVFWGGRFLAPTEGAQAHRAILR